MTFFSRWLARLPEDADLVQPDFLRNLLSRLNRDGFEAFTTDMFGRDPDAVSRDVPFTQLNLPGLDNGIYYRGLVDSYGGSIHSVFIFHYYPPNLTSITDKDAFADPALLRQLGGLRREYKGAYGYYGMVSTYLKRARALQTIALLTNAAGVPRTQYEEDLIPRFSRWVRRAGLRPDHVQIGSYDSYVDLSLEKVRQTVEAFFSERRDGIAISVSPHSLDVRTFALEDPLLLQSATDPLTAYEPVFVPPSGGFNLLRDLERLLQDDAREDVLEEFLRTHYKEIFGEKYDRVETQLWLKFSSLDLFGKDRRLDVFLRNSITPDWELFEIKRPVSLTKTYRDITVLTSAVHDAVQQVRNYERLLHQDQVKSFLAKQGIHYYEPSLNVIIGRRPQIPVDRWRWLVATNSHPVKIVTFDELERDMEVRARERARVFQKTRPAEIVDLTRVATPVATRGRGN